MPRWFAWPNEMRESGILGINRRNLAYISESNARELYPRVDNKLITKRFCEKHQIPAPATYGVLRTHGDVKHFGTVVVNYPDFVVKPARGSTGRGIVVVARHDENAFVTSSGRSMSWPDLRYHLSAVVSGLYSLGGRPDHAIVEQRVVTHPSLEPVAVGGTPDVRVILYLGVPVMAMVRLPTFESGGCANLHQGAVAAAINLTTGVTYGGVCHNRAIDAHPDNGLPIAGMQLPDWGTLLDAAMRLGDVLKLGYLGVDFVFDAVAGPVVLEANARPGLAIQVAHRFGIRPRLDHVAHSRPSDRTGDARWKLMESLERFQPHSVS